MFRSPSARRRLPVAAAFAVCLGLALGSPEAAAVPYSGFYVFGDSLSDTGNIATVTGGAIPPAPYVGGAFTNGPTWADRFAADSGLFSVPQPPLAPGSLLGNVGADYAWGGARTYGHSVAALTPIAKLSKQSKIPSPLHQSQKSGAKKKLRCMAILRSMPERAISF